MGHIITDLKEAFRRGNVYIQLIFINVGVFVITTLIGILLQLFNRSAAGIFELLALPASFTRFAWQPWSIFTYMFMHAGFLHILFNMLWLYWFGALFLYFFSGKHLRGLYIVGGICGGLLYMISYNVFPYFRPMTAYSTMVGASASVLAIVVATAYREPKAKIISVEISGPDRGADRSAVHHIEQCGRTHRPPGRSTGRTLVCSKPEQRERHHFMGQQGARCYRRPVQRQNLEAETQDEGALRKQYPSERLRLQRPQEGTIGRDRPDSRQAEEVGIRESDNRRKKELVRRKQKIAHEAYRQISPILMSGCQRILHRNVTVDSLQPVYQSRSASGAVMPGTDFSHFSRHQLLLSDLLAHRALPFRTGTPTGIPPLLSAVAHLYACQPGNGRTTGKQHQTPFVQHHVLWEHEERERTKPHPELYKKQQRRHRLHAGVCRLRNRQDTSQQ